MIRLGIIGTGGMANSHATHFQAMRGVKITACCDISAERVADFAAKHGIKRTYTDYRDMLNYEALDAITNVTPDAMHADISLAAIELGLHVLCEKPLATSLADAQKMADAAKRAGVINMVNFSYRNSCGAQKAAEVIRRGDIGRVIHVESSYLQSWLVSLAWGNWRENPAWLWRLSTKHGSAGTLGDIGCHIYDLTTLLCGDIAEIDARLQTFDKNIPGNKIGDYVFDANDSFIATVRFADGGLGTIHSSRWATGHGNSLRVRVFGDEGAIEVDLDRSYSEYSACIGKKQVNTNTWKPVKCPPTPNNFQRFIRAIKTGINDPNDFANGAKIQAYLHYSVESDKRRKPVEVKL
ncbi:MAG: Gfo/Idh/MocA family protein [Armatimonadota bacterium]